MSYQRQSYKENAMTKWRWPSIIEIYVNPIKTSRNRVYTNTLLENFPVSSHSLLMFWVNVLQFQLHNSVNNGNCRAFRPFKIDCMVWVRENSKMYERAREKNTHTQKSHNAFYQFSGQFDQKWNIFMISWGNIFLESVFFPSCDG